MHINFVQKSEEQEQSYFFANLAKFTSSGIEIHLNFSDPLFVSQGEVADQVRIKLQREFFLNPNSRNSNIETRRLASLKKYDDGEYIVITQELPLLMPSQEEFKELSDQVGSAKSIMETQFITSFILQVFLSGALSMLWNIFNTLQIILALNLLMVSFPANIEYF